uniref:Uncharacterized protein n=1 Tax=Hucho hucho TaxID=62062 RepID=A0A4W5PFX9_9TELE
PTPFHTPTTFVLMHPLAHSPVVILGCSYPLLSNWPTLPYKGECEIAKMWDLNSNQIMQIIHNDEGPVPVRKIHWIKLPNYSCTPIITGSRDKTLEVGLSSSVRMLSNAYWNIFLPKYPSLISFITVLRSFGDKQNKPTGFALGSIEGRLLDQPITAYCFNNYGNIFAYSSSYDWSKVRFVISLAATIEVCIV